MKAEINPTEKIDRLEENLEKRVEKVEKKGEKLEVEVEEEKKLERIPGIESFKVNGEERKGLQGKPVDELAYARIQSREDVVRAFLATVKGYNLVILNTGREWDLRQLKKYNPDIKHLKTDKPVEDLEIEKSLEKQGELEKVEVEMPGDEEVEKIYREMLT